MTRILDLDLDFFLHGTAHWRDAGSGRLDAEEYPPWSREDALAFLEDRCRLSDPLAGFAVENHGELFELWAATIDDGKLTLPLSVTHVDAHSDLGLGDATYINLLTELLFLDVDDRCPGAAELVNDGNYLAFAIACRWLSDLTLVRNGLGGGRPGDLFPYYMETLNADNIRLEAMTRDQLDRRMRDQDYVSTAVEPEVPLQHMAWSEFEASAPFDVVCLARSPDYTPIELDSLFDEIRARFVDEGASASWKR
jgi:hypothetical protein